MIENKTNAEVNPLQQELDNSLSLAREIDFKNIRVFQDKEEAIHESKTHGWQGKVLQGGEKLGFGWVVGRIKSPRKSDTEECLKHKVIKIPAFYHKGHETWGRDLLTFIMPT